MRFLFKSNFFIILRKIIGSSIAVLSHSRLALKKDMYTKGVKEKSFFLPSRKAFFSVNKSFTIYAFLRQKENFSNV